MAIIFPINSKCFKFSSTYNLPLLGFIVYVPLAAFINSILSGLNNSFDNKDNHSLLSPPASIPISPSNFIWNLLRHCSGFLHQSAPNESVNNCLPLRCTFIFILWKLRGNFFSSCLKYFFLFSISIIGDNFMIKS